MPRSLPSLILVALVSVGTYADAPKTRPFHLGMTRWPSDLTIAAFLDAQEFAHAHGDIVAVMFIGGVPWPEALADKPFSKDVADNLKYRPPNGKKVFLSIAPLNKDRKGLAPYWGAKDNLPLPSPWNRYALNSPEVKKAYRNFVLRAVKEMNPDFLAIGIENNVLLSHDKRKWEQLKDLHAETYAAVKEKHPSLPVCFTTEVLHYRKLSSDAKGSPQEEEVAAMMKHSDLFAMSFYPHMSYATPRPVPENFFDFANKFQKPIAVSESGDTSRDVELKAFKLTLRGSEANQKQFLDALLAKAAKDRYEFVIAFTGTDFPNLCDKLPPPVDDLGRIWAYTGLRTAEKKAKPALDAWDEYLRAEYRR